jgi:hypothetical protein
MWPLPDTLLIPAWAHYDTVNQPSSSSARVEFYSDLWGYDVLCHPDAWRDPAVVFLWTGAVWISVLIGGAWVLWTRGEMSGRYANWMRLGILMVVPVVGWVSFGGPLVLVALKAVFACLAALGTAMRERGSWRNLRRVWGCGVEAARAAWVEGIGLACGHVRQLPVQSGLGSVEEAKEEQKVKEQRAGINLCDDEKPVLGPDTEESATDTDGPLTSTFLRCLQLVAIAPLGYLSLVTLLLCERRASINANAIVDDVLWHLALTGLTIYAHAIIVLCSGAAQFRSNGQELHTVPVPIQPPTDETPLPATDSMDISKTKPSNILFVRFGGLVHGVNINAKNTDKNPLASLGRLGPFDTLASIVIFQHLVYPRGGNDDYPHLDTFINVASKTLILGVIPYLWIVAFAFAALTLTVAHLLLSRILPNSRVVTALQSLSPKMEDLVRWVKARYARAPETLRCIFERCYFPMWILCVYGALYVIVTQEIMRFDTRERLRANNYYCLDLWRDPLAEKLLWPIFWAITR